MSLYWNDECWYFEKIPKKGLRDPNFVMSRKLFVSNITEPLNQKENLAKHFKGFGLIDNIEIFEDIAWNSNADTEISPGSTYSAYVTFKESKSAYLALKDRLQNRKYSSIKIIPADSWRQPTNKLDESTDFDSTLSHIIKLNDDCLLEIFKYCDLDASVRLSNTCTRFRELIQRNVFPRFKSLVLNFMRDEISVPYRMPRKDEIDAKPSRLVDLYNQMCAVGQHIEEVKLLFDEIDYFHPKNVNRIMNIFTTHVGRSLRKLTVIGITLTKEMQDKLHCFFQRLELLEYHACIFEFYYKCDLVNTCPNLKTLKLSCNIYLDVNVNKWQSLENVILNYTEFFSEYDYITFLKNNSNIKSFGFQTFHLSSVLSNVHFYLKSLEKLVIRSTWRGVEASQISVVKEMENLTILKLIDAHEEHLSTLLVFLSQIPQLRYIKITVNIEKFNDIQTYFTNSALIKYSWLISLAKTMPNLRKLSLRRCKLRYKTILDFILYANALEVLDLRVCEVRIRKDLIRDIVKCKMLQKKNKNETNALRLIIDQEIDDESRGLLQHRNTKEVLQVETKISNPDKKSIYDLRKITG